MKNNQYKYTSTSEHIFPPYFRVEGATYSCTFSSHHSLLPLANPNCNFKYYILCVWRMGMCAENCLPEVAFS
jgi:hypothetical protein